MDCTIPFEICRLRVTRLDAVGNVAPEPNNFWVTDKITQLVITPDVETGADRVLLGGCGCIIAAAKISDLRKRWTVAIDKGSIEPGLEELLLGDTVITSGGDAIGVWSTPQIGCDTSGPPNVAIEAWSKNYDFDHQDAALPWIHTIFPMAEFQRTAQTLNDDFATSGVTGFTRVNPVWGNGPYADQPEAVAAGADMGQFKTAIDPPAAACAYGSITPGS